MVSTRRYTFRVTAPRVTHVEVGNNIVCAARSERIEFCHCLEETAREQPLNATDDADLFELCLLSRRDVHLGAVLDKCGGDRLA